MAMEDICIEYEGHQVPVPYEVVNMITIAKETSGAPHEAWPTLTDEYIARILKYWPPEKETAAKYDYRVVMEQKAVQQIYQGIHDQGGLWRCFPGRKPLAAVTVLRAILNIVKTMHYWRGLDKNERKTLKELNKRWQEAWKEEQDQEEETEVETGEETEEESGESDFRYYLV